MKRILLPLVVAAAIQSAPALTHQLLAGAAYATKFTSAEGPVVAGASTTSKVSTQFSRFGDPVTTITAPPTALIDVQ